ncbi:hypothetical protein OAC10_01035 [bacterium]|nr:hypothetical protein [bacterium]
MKRQRRRQEGAVLLIALLMLLLLNIFTVASISSSNINMQVIQSQQRLSEVQQVAANVSNYIFSDLDYFINYRAYLDSDDNFSPEFPNGLLAANFGKIDIEVNSLTCLLETNLAGCSLDGTSPCLQETVWQLSISAMDKSSGAQTTHVEGLSLSYLAGYCP